MAHPGVVVVPRGRLTALYNPPIKIGLTASIRALRVIRLMRSASAPCAAFAWAHLLEPDAYKPTRGLLTVKPYFYPAHFHLYQFHLHQNYHPLAALQWLHQNHPAYHHQDYPDQIYLHQIYPVNYPYRMLHIEIQYQAA